MVRNSICYNISAAWIFSRLKLWTYNAVSLLNAYCFNRIICSDYTALSFSEKMPFLLLRVWVLILLEGIAFFYTKLGNLKIFFCFIVCLFFCLSFSYFRSNLFIRFINRFTKPWKHRFLTSKTCFLYWFPPSSWLKINIEKTTIRSKKKITINLS